MIPKKMSMFATGLFLFVIVFTSSCENTEKDLQSFSNFSGPYLGQTLAGDDPEIFAPGLISTAMATRDMAMTPDGKEIYFCATAFGTNLIYFTKEINGVWSEASLAPFITDVEHMYFEPHITADGSKMLFLSDMSVKEGEPATQDIWAVDRQGDDWGKAYNLGLPVNTDGNEFFPTTTRDGTLYFTRAEKGTRIHYIYRSKFVDGNYQEPERLGDKVNCGTNRFNAFIDPDERFIIIPVMGMEDGLGGADYYVVFRDTNDRWSEPVNLGPKVNQDRGAEWSPYISPDGKYFFFMSSRINKLDGSVDNFPTYRELGKLFNKPGNGNSAIYWMRADFIFKLQ
ncbi:MAG: PD40 domain-containing protein [Candidatus Marinimicrobia bacterium]|nr:PD40 domain-containing protein [Candidatus Neomarinimicrobiota bacterium]